MLILNENDNTNNNIIYIYLHEKSILFFYLSSFLFVIAQTAMKGWAISTLLSAIPYVKTQR